MSGSTDLNLLVKIARLYYEEGLTQQAIARELNGRSRMCGGNLACNA